jgi:hypothetical protein
MAFRAGVSMRVRCVGRSIENLPDTYVDVRKRLGEGPFPLTVGRTYVVYAIEARAGAVDYHIHDDEGSATRSGMRRRPSR